MKNFLPGLIALFILACHSDSLQQKENLSENNSDLSNSEEQISTVKSLHPLEIKDQMLFLNIDGTLLPERKLGNPLGLSDFENRAYGDKEGIHFHFNCTDLNGRLWYGLIPLDDSRHPMPVYYATPVEIKEGKAFVPVQKRLSGLYDMVGWERNGFGLLGFRVVKKNGKILYEGKVGFKKADVFKVVPSIIEGPWVQKLGSNQVTVSFETDLPVKSQIRVRREQSVIALTQESQQNHHEFLLEGLLPSTEYSYQIQLPDYSERYSFRTAPEPGTGSAFTFGYASDSRGGNGGGERDVYGVNAYTLKKIMALSSQEQIAFFQFSGDLIDGYSYDEDEIRLEYRNFKRAVEPFAHYFPIYYAMGNHEVFLRSFGTKDSVYRMDAFPYETRSAESFFAREFNQPVSSLQSEDGSALDPDSNHINFPSYRENVFYYQYDNLAMVVLNSNYWYVPSMTKDLSMGGNVHGYLMDKQLEWLKATIEDLEKNSKVDHIFITLHTPLFPNGGHLDNDMWYKGNNKLRPSAGGKMARYGIIERRDQLLDILVNQSVKTRAILTGDEHNYCKTRICDEMTRYPNDYPHPKVQLNRVIYQINNGSAGAPYYAQESAPWKSFTSAFTTQNAVVLFNVHESEIDMKVVNPDTLEAIDELKLK